MMRSESTSAFGQPSDTKPTFGATAVRLFCAADAGSASTGRFGMRGF